MSTTRRRFPIYLPVLLLAFLAIGWCGFWWLAASKLEEGVDSWMAREARAGRLYACEERDIGGFPFRLEIDCRNPKATLPADGGPINLAAGRFVAVAQVYRPTHVVGEFRGPLTITHPATPDITAQWSFAGASLMGSAETLERVSLVVEGLDMRAGAEGTPVAAMARLEAHARPTPDTGAGSYDVISSIKGAVVPVLDSLLGSSAPTDIELQASIRGIDDLRPRPTSERLKAFADAGGNLRIALAKLTRGDVALESKGDIKLDAQGRPEGRLDVTVRGVEKLATLAPALGDFGPLAGAGLNFLGQKATLDGANARRFDVTLGDGVARLGGIPLAQVPSLY